MIAFTIVTLLVDVLLFYNNSIDLQYFVAAILGIIIVWVLYLLRTKYLAWKESSLMTELKDNSSAARNETK